MSITCIIVEDEPLALERTKSFVERLPYLQLQSVFDNGIDALVYLRSHPVDLIFLDINLGDFSGIHLIESAKITAAVIIISAYPEYALKGFELNVTDYLLKPYTLERFIQAVERVKAEQDATPEFEKKFIFVKTEYRLQKILFSEIIYIEGMRDYRRIHTPGKQIMTLQTFKYFESEIPRHILCRIHKSYMIAVDQIDSVEKDGIRIGKKLFPISETYKKDFLMLIHQTGKL